METTPKKSRAIDYEKDDFIKNNSVNLNYDCLIHIFSYLPINERIRVEGVCKSWREASLASWSNVKTLNFWEIKPSLFEKRPKDIHAIDDVIKKTLSRCGTFVKNITKPNHSRWKIPEQNVKTIIEMCPNLQSMFIQSVDVHLIGLLASKCKYITKLRLDDINGCCDDKFLEKIFTQLLLKDFGLSENVYITGSCLKQLSATNIEEIRLNECYNLHMSTALKIMQNFKNLHTLKFCGYRLITLTGLFIETIRKLNLKTLDISGSNDVIDDNFLIELVRAAGGLKKLDISGNERITDLGLAAISNLHNLESLNVDRLILIKGEILLNLPKLKHLSCKSCWSMSSTGMINFLNASEKIESIRFGFLSNISEDFIRAAVKATKARNNGITLKISASYLPQELFDIIKDISSEDTPLLKFEVTLLSLEG